MVRNLIVAALCACVFLAGCESMQKMCGTALGWQSLFDGKTMDGWKANENTKTWTVRDGMLVTHGERSHLFYVGPVNNANFTNFEFKADVKTEPGSNSGIYFHTEYQESGWPSKGYECQVNQTFKADPKKTGGLYNVVNIDEKDNPAKDNEWYTQHIIVSGKHVVVNIITGIEGSKPTVHKVVDYIEPDNLDRKQPRLSSGTFALQGHDPKSTVYYKNVMVKPLP